MEITEVRVKLVNGKNDKLRAFCSITIDNDFVIRDLKVIDGAKGPFVAMPSRKLMEKCPKCHSKNHFRARYCNECGKSLPRSGRRVDEDSLDDEAAGGRSKLHTEIAHPINSTCRERIQGEVLKHYHLELEEQQEDTPSGSGESAPEPVEEFDNFGNSFAESEKQEGLLTPSSRLEDLESAPPARESGYQERSRDLGASRREKKEEGAGWSAPRGERDPLESRNSRTPGSGELGTRRTRPEPDPERNPRSAPGPRKSPATAPEAGREGQRYYDDPSLGDDSEPEDNFGAGIL